MTSTPNTLRELFRSCWEESEPWYKEGMDAAAAWDNDKELLAIAGRLIDGLNAQISEYLNILESTDGE
jgi:hypothetical protein